MNRNFSDDSSDQIKFGDMGCTNVLSVFCWDTNLAVGDMLGHYTYYTPNGASVVDYVMVSEGILDQVLYFKVTDFIPTLSTIINQIQSRFFQVFIKPFFGFWGIFFIYLASV
jgi:hypothetical protein